MPSTGSRTFALTALLSSLFFACAENGTAEPTGALRRGGSANKASYPDDEVAGKGGRSGASGKGGRAGAAGKGGSSSKGGASGKGGAVSSGKGGVSAGGNDPGEPGGDPGEPGGDPGEPGGDPGEPGGDPGGDPGAGGTGQGTGTGSCCEATPGAPGCSDGAIQSCICAQDDYCCATEWDDQCVGEVAKFGCGDCGGGVGGDPAGGGGDPTGGGGDPGEPGGDPGEPGGDPGEPGGDPTGGGGSPGGSCCEATPGTKGCGDSAIQSCVCAQDDYCCATEWDDQCVGEVAKFGCGDCGGGTGGDPTGGGGNPGGADCSGVGSFDPPSVCDKLSGNTTSEIPSNNFFSTSWFGCYRDSGGTLHTDPGDNCEFACGNKGLCASGLSGPECQAEIKWFSADADRFGCGSRIRVTNCANGKSVVLAVLDRGPNCKSVEQKYGAPVLDISHDAMDFLFNGKFFGGGDKQGVLVEKVDAATPLGP